MNYWLNYDTYLYLTQDQCNFFRIALIILMYLIVSPDAYSTGNLTTLNRLKGHFTKNSIDLVAKSPNDFISEIHCSLCTLNKFIIKEKIKAVLLVHAYKSGRILICACKTKQVPNFKYCVIYGGTDINVDTNEPKKLEVMKICVENSCFVWCFTKSLSQCPSLYSKFSFIHPQAVAPSLYSTLGNKKNYTSSAPYIFLLPTSIRPVKDPSFLIESFLKIKCHLKYNVRLLIIGPKVDEAFFDIFSNEVKLAVKSDRTCTEMSINKYFSTKDCKTTLAEVESWINDPGAPFIQYMPPLESKAILQLMSSGKLCALLNSSNSEGMASSILEGMAVGLPVIARNIPGNSSVISHGINGLLFNSTEDFIDNACELMHNTRLRTKVIENGINAIREFHSPDKEAEFLFKHLKCL